MKSHLLWFLFYFLCIINVQDADQRVVDKIDAGEGDILGLEAEESKELQDGDENSDLQDGDENRELQYGDETREQDEDENREQDGDETREQDGDETREQDGDETREQDGDETREQDGDENRKLELGNRGLELGNRKLELGNRKLELETRELELGNNEPSDELSDEPKKMPKSQRISDVKTQKQPFARAVDRSLTLLTPLTPLTPTLNALAATRNVNKFFFQTSETTVEAGILTIPKAAQASRALAKEFAIRASNDDVTSSVMTGSSGRSSIDPTSADSFSSSSVYEGTTVFGVSINSNTTIVNLATVTNTTSSIGDFVPPTFQLTPIPTPTNLLVEEVSFDFLNIKSNASSYNLGGLLPLTINGSYVLQGVQYVEAFKCQLSLLNSNQTILPFSYIAYLIQNTELSLPLTTYQAFLLQNFDTFMVVGPMNALQTPPVGHLYGVPRTTFVSFDASEANVVDPIGFPSFFRTITPDTFQARAMAETMTLFGWSFVAALFTADIYGTSGQAALIAQTGRQNIMVTCLASIVPGSILGLPDFADCVASSDASVVVLWMDEVNAANALSYLYRNATNTRLTFMASDRWAIIEDPLLFNNTIARTNTSFPLSFIEGTLGFVPLIGQLGQYKACASQVNPSNTNYTAFYRVWEQEFRCSLNSTDNIPECPQEISARRFECRCTGNEDFASLPVDRLVNYVQDAVSVMYNALDALFNPRRCATLNYPSICNLERFTPADYVTALSLVSITGLTGEIQFNQTQPDRRRSSVDIFQYSSVGTTRQVGYWNITSPYLSTLLLDFKTSPHYPVSILIPDNTNFGTTFWTVIVPIVAGIAIFAALVILVIFTVFYKSRVVRRSNLLWLWMMYGGIVLILSSLIIWTFVQTTFVCTLKSIVGMLGFTLLTCCVVIKAQRIYRVLINSGNVSTVLGTGEILLVTVLVAIPDIAIMMLYLFGGELPQATITQSTNDPTYLYITCTPKSINYNNGIVAAFLAYNLLLILVCAVFLFVSRHLQTPYYEGEFMFLSLLDFLLLSAIMIPLYYTVGNLKGSNLQAFLLRSLTILFSMVLTLMLLSYPKLYALFGGAKKKEDAASERTRSSGYDVYTPVPGDYESETASSDFTSASSTGRPGFVSQTNRDEGASTIGTTNEGSSRATTLDDKSKSTRTASSANSRLSSSGD